MSKILIIDTQNPTIDAEWRTYKGLDFQLAPLFITDLRRIRKEVADLGLDTVEEANELDSRMTDHIIRDWRGPVTPERTKLPLTKVNKFTVINFIPGLKNWLLPESDRIADARIIDLEEQLGNSGGSPAGSASALAGGTGEH